MTPSVLRTTLHSYMPSIVTSIVNQYYYCDQAWVDTQLENISSEAACLALLDQLDYTPVRTLDFRKLPIPMTNAFINQVIEKINIKRTVLPSLKQVFIKAVNRSDSDPVAVQPDPIFSLLTNGIRIGAALDETSVKSIHSVMGLLNTDTVRLQIQEMLDIITTVWATSSDPKKRLLLRGPCWLCVLFPLTDAPQDTNEPQAIVQASSNATAPSRGYPSYFINNWRNNCLNFNGGVDVI